MREIVKNAMRALTPTRFLNTSKIYCFFYDNVFIRHGTGTRCISTASNEGEGDTATTTPTPLTRNKPLFTEAASFSELTRKDANTYITISEEDLKRSIGEGLPAGLTKEYEETKGSSLLVRASFLELRDELKACVEKAKNPNAQVRNPRKQFILDGPVSSGKSITLAMLVHWARSEGWFVFYVPNGKEWTHGGFYYKNPVAPTWDTPKQAITVLERLLKSHETILKRLPCQIFEPITLGEGPGIGMMKDAEVVAMPKGSSLFDLVQTGLTCSHAAVGVVVRLREELPLVKEVPVLFVIDQFNSWFTFSQYKEYTGRFSHRDIHARELTMVKPYRSMLHNDMMVAAYSHSTAVGKLRKHLPDTPLHVRYDFPRYSIDEAEAVIDYYSRQKLISHERFSEDKWKRIFYLANGNGSEIRNLVRFI
ncbi:hypothetical protein SUGI_0739590 [Cryptomeria japonica]|uniref:uncharacterized protein LOC131030387 n=1 Tax=Cryptomeria japonica TaxID=3369 RepID=UPI002414AA25|nr:uncharacterized protein LOC131030387 [Cryptomeria japonica]XP_057817168.1 uncharacterized protein LOC131030387 [Cryptomeria japonica]GLJ36734.1 hypothetical protein SUGI_0739590 [Cryptomeria japonica]